MADQRLGDYRIVRELGRGRAGVVHQCDGGGTQVAIKVVEAGEGRDGQVRAERYFGESESASAMRHAGIVQTLGRGETSDGQGYLVMELIDGATLRMWLGGGATPELPEALAVARRIAAAVGAAHERRIVHGGLRPENVFLVGARPDAIKVTDFGLGRLLGTRGKVSAAEVAYLSPERCRRPDRLDVGDDLYAFGCILFEMVCGRPPFPHGDRESLIAAHTGQPAPAPRSLIPALPQALDRLILSLLRKTPGDRPRNLRLVDEALDRIISGAPDLMGEQGWPATREQSSAPRLTPLGHVHLHAGPRDRASGSGSPPWKTESTPRRTPLGQAHLHMRSLVVEHSPPRPATAFPAVVDQPPSEPPAPPPEAVSPPPESPHDEADEKTPATVVTSLPVRRRPGLAWVLGALVVVAAGVVAVRVLRGRGVAAPRPEASTQK
jgi:serine/threonine protein kinase